VKGFLLDTNIPSELIRTRPEPREANGGASWSGGLKTTCCPDFKDASCRSPNPSPTAGESWMVKAN
jgi:hypothetical protein